MKTVGTGRTDSGPDGSDPLLWYAAYGSNLHAARFACYLYGGRPEGAALACPGCRDRRPPRATAALTLPGTLYFAGSSPTWGGATASYDPAGPGPVPARGYLLTLGQFSDVAAQEMHRPPGADLDLTRVLATGRDRAGPGRYETLLRVGSLGGRPVLTFTSPTGPAGARLAAPTGAYLRTLGAGLEEAHGWGPWRAAGYLATRPGAAGHWTVAAVAALLGWDEDRPGAAESTGTGDPPAGARTPCG
ncbi:histone deacetylase [Kitasatospora sp. NPDC094011]|uniref:histone deacetylase n=1 Tax=Kitasatospora sp. NPDC094011 TaxID=3364090 RepID=UPI00381FB7C9